MEPETDRKPKRGAWDSGLGPGVSSIGDLVPEVLDRGSRRRGATEAFPEDQEDEGRGEYRVRSPTNSERMNRALVELTTAAFKIHTLLWKWRGAPARGLLPYFTIHSLSKFCRLSRPTVRVGLRELHGKGWIQKTPYNKHHKNALYRLTAIRKVPRPIKKQ